MIISLYEYIYKYMYMCIYACMSPCIYMCVYLNHVYDMQTYMLHYMFLFLMTEIYPSFSQHRLGVYLTLLGIKCCAKRWPILLLAGSRGTVGGPSREMFTLFPGL